MSDLQADQTSDNANGVAPQTAGAMLRQARQAQGLHIAALAAAIKVTPRKLEALESDRYEELLDATFTRALAQAVCRALKIDAEPVLARLPQAPGKGLDHVASGINAPFRERGSRREASEFPRIGGPLLWGSIALLVAAAVVYFLPAGLFGARTGAGPAGAASAPAESASAVSEPVPAPAVLPVVQAAAAASAPAAAASMAVPLMAAAAPAASMPASAPSSVVASGNRLTLETAGPSWVDIRDGNGKVLISRLVQEGESLSFDVPATPVRVKIGNAAATRLNFRGLPVSLSNVGRDNVARLELK